MCDPMTSDNKKDKFNIEETNKKLWKNVHNNNLWNDNAYPTTNAQAFYKYHLQPMIIDSSKPIKLLDVGCGTGNNTIFFAKNGCSTYGIDISEAALISADKRSKATNVVIELSRSSFTNLDFMDNYFDAVFCDGALYYGDGDTFTAGLEEMYRVLKTGGVARIYTKNNHDVWANPNNKIKDHTYVVEVGYENGMTVYCPSLSIINTKFCKFSDVKVGIESFNYIGLNGLKSFHVITAIK